jgi:AcrR family transcriptional regulator
MGNERKNSKQGLMDAAVRLIARKGLKAATVRSIASEAGVTEGALYRHYASKEALYVDVYTRLVTEMIEAKQTIASSSETVRQKLHEWVRVSYGFFDRHPDAFSFVLLTEHDLPEPQRKTTSVQGQIFMDLVEKAQHAGEIRPILPELALSHFTGIMLNVPRLINEGILEGPALKYVDDVADAAWDALSSKQRAPADPGEPLLTTDGP